MTARIKDSDIEHLSWIYDRLANVHSENTNFDYMHKLNAIIANLKLDYAYYGDLVLHREEVRPVGELIETPEEKEALDAIEQVEWNGKGLPPVGVECEFMCEGFWGDSHYHWCIFLGLLSDGSYAIEFNHPTSPKRVTCQCFDPQCTKFRKLETPEEKKERERIESAKHLYSKHCKEVRHPVKDLDNNSVLLNAWLVIVDETGYRKSLNDVNGKG